MAEDQGRATPEVPEDRAPDGAVVVGIDGQAHDEYVVSWAADEAARLGRPLHIQEVVDLGISLMAGEGYLPMTSLPADSLEGDRTALATAAQRARAHHPDLSVTLSSAPGSVTGVLVALTERATTLVVGGGGEPGSPFIGSTALSIAAHAKCPTVVLPDRAGESTGKVVVGVDGSAASRAAAAYALEFAAAHQASVRCVICWSVEMVDGCVVTEPGSPEWQLVEERHVAVVEDALADLRVRHPHVPVEVVVRRGPSSEVLTEEARTARLLAVGNRGRGGFLGMLLGSTTKRVLKDATGPVVIVRQ